MSYEKGKLNHKQRWICWQKLGLHVWRLYDFFYWNGTKLDQAGDSFTKKSRDGLRWNTKKTSTARKLEQEPSSINSGHGSRKPATIQPSNIVGWEILSRGYCYKFGNHLDGKFRHLHCTRIFCKSTRHSSAARKVDCLRRLSRCFGFRFRPSKCVWTCGKLY